MKKIFLILALVIISLTTKAQYCTTNLYSVGCYSSSSIDYSLDSLSFGYYNNYNIPCNQIAGQLGYANLTVITSNLMQGNTYNLKFKIKSPSASNYVKAWIDYNNDTTFNNTNELVLQLNNISQGFYNQNITIPTIATTGPRRMRIRMNSGYNFTNACDTSTYGQFVDYTVNIGGINDIAVDSILIPSDSAAFGSLIHPTIKLHNYGNTTLNGIQVYYRVNNIPCLIENLSGSIAPGNSMLYTFINPFNVPIGNFNFCARAIVIGDINHSNDSLCKNVLVYGTGPITDIGVYAIVDPIDSMAIGDVIYPTVLFHNYGNTTINSFNVGYSVNGTICSDFYSGGPIAPGGSSFPFVFTVPITVPSINFIFCVWVSLVGDVNTSNDSTCKNIIAYVLPPKPHDVSIQKIITPKDTVPTNTTQTIKVVIKNNGTSIETSIPVYYQRGSASPVSTLWTGTLLPGDTVQYTFTSTFTAPAGASFSFCAWTKLATDQDTTNDKLCKTVYLCQLPSSPGVINNVTSPGVHTVYFGSTVVFCISNVNGASSYQWICTFPGAVIIGYPNDSCVTIQFNMIGSTGNFSLSVKGINSCGIGNSSPNYNLYVTSPGGGINELNAFNIIKLSPNPTSDKLNINISAVKKGIIKFSIYNIQGAKLYNQKDLITTDTYNKIIDVATLKAGIYFIKIENEEGVFNTKFVKE